MNGQSEKFSELCDERRDDNFSPKGGSVINLNFNGYEDDEPAVKPNHVEKISRALSTSLNIKADIKNTGSKSDHGSNGEDSISMRDDFENMSDVYNDKLKRELEIAYSDLTKLRKQYDDLSQNNLSLKRQVSLMEERMQLLDSKVIKLEKVKAELLINEKKSDKEIKDLQARRKAAKLEIMSLNHKLSKVTSKAVESSKNEISILNEEQKVKCEEPPKAEETHFMDNYYEKAFNKSSRMLKRLKKSIEDLYIEVINLLVHSEQTNFSGKSMVYATEKAINLLKISINDHFDDLSIIEKTRKDNQSGRSSVMSAVVAPSSKID